jgi:hypothetical protein
MVGERQGGYTVIEVALFMAITGLLFLIVIFGTGSTIRNMRFTDSGRSLAAFVQQQYDDIINGLNTRPGLETCSGGIVTTGSNQTPGTSNCLLMGQLLVFTVGSGTVSVYNIIGTEPAGVDYAQTDQALITLFAPSIVTNTGTSSFDIPWGSTLSGTKRTSDDKGVTGVLLVRSPKSSRIISYSYVTPASITTLLIDSTGAGVVSNAANVAKTNNFCIKNADGLGLPAKLVVDDRQTQSAVQIVFDADASGSECNGT